jgi:hypothetical protein
MVTTSSSSNNNTATIKPKVNITSSSSSTTHNNDMTGGSNNNNSNNLYSYHNSIGSNDINTNPYEIPPTIHQYHDTNTTAATTTTSSSSSIFHGLRSISNSGIGDTTLLPNIGRTNRYAEYALFGLAYHELIMRLHLSITITAVLVLVVLFLTWYIQLFQPIHLVLSAVVAILSFILVMVEGKTLWSNIFSSSQQPQSVATTSSSSVTSTASSSSSSFNAASTPENANNPTTIHIVMRQLERIGTIILYHPIGKTLYLLTCSLLCFYITGIAMFLFGCLFFFNALTLIYCYVTYPECRKSFESLQQQQQRQESSTMDTNNDSSSSNNVARSWSSYYSDIANTATVSSWVSERASLLRS